jgi:bacteriocin biosynthesis cyclodehydratase domain-containing protein
VTHDGGSLTDNVGGPRYRLRPSVEAFVSRHGELCLVRPGDQDRVVRTPDEADIALVRALESGWRSAGDLTRSLALSASLLQPKLDALAAADLVLVNRAPAGPPLAGDDEERFARQLPYLAEMGDEIELQRQLRAATIAVLGCGGLGTWAVAALACIGIGRIVLVDDDRIALSNLNRQILYTRNDVDRAKVAAVAEWVRAFDPVIDVGTVERRIESPDDVTPLIADADAVVLAADWPPYEIGRWVNAACVQARVPFIVAGQLPPLLKVGPTYAVQGGPCFTCHETALARASHAYEDYVRFRASRPVTAPTVGPGSCVAGGLMGLELLHLLTGHVPATRDAALLIDMRTLAVRAEPVERDPECSTCKHLE